MTPAPSANPPLTHAERRTLLAFARHSMELAAQNGKMTEGFGICESGDPNLHRPSGAFVTLHLRKRLRGCIGQLPGEQHLWWVVMHCAQSAALDDPRFEPVRPDEVADIDIEISVLSQPLDTLPEMIEAGKHGLIVSHGSHHGVLLPQVATQFHWDSMHFLEETCEKAGLAREAWKDPSVRIQTFTAEVFSESDYPAEKKEGEPSPGSP